MIAATKDWAKAHWPRLRLRTYLVAALFLGAALPGVGAVFLRVYENTLVRQTEAELVAQGAALAAAAAVLWPTDAPPGRAAPASPMPSRGPYDPAVGTEIDLSVAPILRERPAPRPVPPPASDARAAARRLSPVLDETRAATLASIILLDRDGRIVAGNASSGSLSDLPEVAAALGGTARTVLRRHGGYRAVYRFEWLSRAAAIRIHHARPILVDGRVVGTLLLSRSARALFRGLYEDRGKILFGVAVIFALLLALSGLLSRGIARPIEALGRATRDVAAGGGSIPDAPSTAAIEIQALYADFAVMADRIERRARYLRDFAYAVAHEFKTPIAGIRGAVELLEDHGDTMTRAERSCFHANVAADADRLSRLTGRLLDLARADMAEVERGATTPLAPLLDRFARLQSEQGLAVTIDGPRDGLIMSMPAGVVEAALATLADNSRQAAARRLAIRVTIAGDRVLLDVADDGPGIAAADRARIFELFFTSHRADGGTGLGLPIARSLIEAGGGAITLLDDAPGACFRLDLPLAPAAVRG